MRQAAPYSNISKRYFLFLYEKLPTTLYLNWGELLNETSEAISNCIYLNNFLLMNFKSSD